MIKYKDSEIIQILRTNASSLPETKAISYAIHRAVAKLVDYSMAAGVYSAVDRLPERTLDLLAIECRSQYYDEDMQLETKRDILKKTLLWYHNAGTPSAVQELVTTIFGVGEVREWFEYGGEPYRFKIVSNAPAGPDTIAMFEKIIKRVKNTRSHLERVEFVREPEAPLYVGIGLYSKVSVRIGWEGGADGAI